MDKEKYIQEIINFTGLEKNEINEMIKHTQNELKNKISEEGAIFVISKELGLNCSKSGHLHDEYNELYKILKDGRINLEIIKKIISELKISNEDISKIFEYMPKVLKNEGIINFTSLFAGCIYYITNINRGLIIRAFNESGKKIIADTISKNADLCRKYFRI